MAEKEPVIVIKKVTVQGGGGHGGSWKVAFADFMTALMAFFLLMWLLSQTEAVKENVADYFSTPSVIEYNFSNYGVQLTLEKLFLDLVNEPLKFFQAFMQPADYTPNFMQMGSKKIVMQQMASKLKKWANTDSFNVTSRSMEFEIPAKHLFKTGQGQTSASFVEVMGKVREITNGLKNSNIYIDSVIYPHNVKGRSEELANQVAQKRLDHVTEYVSEGLEHATVDIYEKKVVNPSQRQEDGRPAEAVIRFEVKQKSETAKGRKPRELDAAFGEADETMDVYNRFVDQVSSRKDKKK